MQHFHGQVREIQEQNAEQQLVQFNTQFTVYADREDITIYDILTVVNLAKDNNAKNDESENKIEVHIITNSTAPRNVNNAEQDAKAEDLEKLIIYDRNYINEEHRELPKYKCKIENNSNGRVQKITFTRMG